MKYCSINGITQNTIAITDRGLAYGDGIFTTAKIVDGQVVLISKHIDRLIHGCNKLNIPVVSGEDLTAQLHHAAQDFSNAVIKVMITSGSGGRGYSRVGLDESSTNIIIMVSDFPKHYNALSGHGINLGISTQEIAISPMLSGLKHLNRLEQVMLRSELDGREEDDLVVTNCQGYVIEATSSNLFYWLNNRLCTPDLIESGVNGIIRQEILEHTPDILVHKTRLDDLQAADAMFICNSLMGVMPVNKYNNRTLAIDKVLALQNTLKGSI